MLNVVTATIVGVVVVVVVVVVMPWRTKGEVIRLIES